MWWCRAKKSELGLQRVFGAGRVFLVRNRNESKRHFSASALNIQAKAHYIQGNHNQAPLHSRTTPAYLSNSANIPSQPGTTVVRMALWVSKSSKKRCSPWHLLWTGGRVLAEVANTEVFGVAPHHPLGEISCWQCFFSYEIKHEPMKRLHMWMATWRRRCFLSKLCHEVCASCSNWKLGSCQVELRELVEASRTERYASRSLAWLS